VSSDGHAARPTILCVPLHEFPLDADEQQPLAAWLDGPHADPATPRGASTVLLLREGADTADGVGDVEVFLLRRRPSMAFAPRMHVFPGGGVDPRDSDTTVPWVGPGPLEWGRLLGAPAELASALVCAAVRELFEECGVLLAGSGDPGLDASSGVLADLSDPSWERDRLALLDRSLAMSDLLVRRGLALRSDLLRPWAHWTTPEFEPRRYDTWFFLAALPEGQQAREIGEEADRAHWIGLDAMVAGHDSGRLAMLPPTVMTVSDLVAAVRSSPPGMGGVEAALATRRRLGRVMPWLAKRADGTVTMLIDADGRGGGRSGP
jgi:8-oxo-dGTP pyrophosphatase MutT (NUDIX family)